MIYPPLHTRSVSLLLKRRRTLFPLHITIPSIHQVQSLQHVFPCILASSHCVLSTLTAHSLSLICHSYLCTSLSVGPTLYDITYLLLHTCSVPFLLGRTRPFFPLHIITASTQQYENPKRVTRLPTHSPSLAFLLKHAHVLICSLKDGNPRYIYP